jgi:hypothetical protein
MELDTPSFAAVVENTAAFEAVAPGAVVVRKERRVDYNSDAAAIVGKNLPPPAEGKDLPREVPEGVAHCIQAVVGYSHT